VHTGRVLVQLDGARFGHCLQETQRLLERRRLEIHSGAWWSIGKHSIIKSRHQHWQFVIAHDRRATKKRLLHKIIWRHRRNRISNRSCCTRYINNRSRRFNSRINNRRRRRNGASESSNNLIIATSRRCQPQRITIIVQNFHQLAFPLRRSGLRATLQRGAERDGRAVHSDSNDIADVPIGLN
jgi:hypothetical protein